MWLRLFLCGWKYFQVCIILGFSPYLFCHIQTLVWNLFPCNLISLNKFIHLPIMKKNLIASLKIVLFSPPPWEKFSFTHNWNVWRKKEKKQAGAELCQNSTKLSLNETGWLVSCAKLCSCLLYLVNIELVCYVVFL